MIASYTTSFQCSDGSYVLISGDNLTLEYDYGYSYSQVRMTLSIIICTAMLNFLVPDKAIQNR